ncbi:protein DENND6A-like [Oppia nitens]|uniref:protein DENND6A-like n=1 Tax=Oppia nitens TaxID=1686743 RepID=UPI0023DB6FD6|nr:protein DENND6A-like [Oppia nitens]
MMAQEVEQNSDQSVDTICNKKSLLQSIDRRISTVDELVDDMTSLETTILPLDRFKQWVYCIAIVAFDIELGQTIQQIYPASVKLTEREISNICYLSFPDSNSGCMGDTQFHFRTRLCPIHRKSVSIYKDYNKNCYQPLQVDGTHFYGYVYFRQVKDRTARRGYFQKSLVFLTRLPFVRLFSQVIQLMAPQFFECGDASLEAACHDIDQWPPPTPGSTLNLPLLGVILQITIPNKTDKLNHSPNTENPNPSLSITALNDSSISSSSSQQSLTPYPLVIPSVYELNIYKSLASIITHVQLLWELILTCEPITVMASTPDVCSETVQSLVGLILPIKYGSDFRPFFTIHDSEFKEYTTKTQSPPPVILGVTNPFFAKTLQHWPHIIRIGDYGSVNNHKNKIKKTGIIKTLDSKTGVYTKYKPFLQKDREILKKLVKGIEMKRPQEVQSALLRRFFIELTQSFLIPLERYFASLMPLQKNVSPFKKTPILQHFRPDDFLKSLETSGPQLTSNIKGDWIGLYRKFLRCPNFISWYDSRLKEANQKLRVLHMEAISGANLMDWIRDKAEVEVVDLILRLKEKLSLAENDSLPLSDQTVYKLRSTLNDIINTLPDDLKHILSKS